MSLPALTDLELAGWEVLAQAPGARRFTPTSVRRWVLQRGVRDWDAMTDLPLALRAELAGRWRIRRGALERRYDSRDGTMGLLTRLDDGQIIESVSIPDEDRRTLCLSSQVGCAVACRLRGWKNQRPPRLSVLSGPARRACLSPISWRGAATA